MKNIGKKEQKRIEKRLKFVNKQSDNCLFYIQRGYVGNCVLFWALNNQGYTTDIDKAQIYTKQYVLDNFIDCKEEDRILIASHVQQRIKRTVDSQYIESKYICF